MMGGHVLNMKLGSGSHGVFAHQLLKEGKVILPH